MHRTRPPSRPASPPRARLPACPPPAAAAGRWSSVFLTRRGRGGAARGAAALSRPVSALSPAAGPGLAGLSPHRLPLPAPRWRAGPFGLPEGKAGVAVSRRAEQGARPAPSPLGLGRVWEMGLLLGGGASERAGRP